MAYKLRAGQRVMHDGEEIFNDTDEDQPLDEAKFTPEQLDALVDAGAAVKTTKKKADAEETAKP